MTIEGADKHMPEDGRPDHPWLDMEPRERDPLHPGIF